MSKRNKKSYVVIEDEGDPCPRCGKPTQIQDSRCSVALIPAARRR